MTELDIGKYKIVGFIGLGVMGSRMVKHLVGCEKLIVSDRDAVRAREISQELGAEIAKEMSDFAAADAVILMLPNSEIIDGVVNGTHEYPGLLDVLAPGAAIIDMSSANPANTVKNAQLAASKGINYIDAPVSGGPAGAQSGKLAIMVGGTDHQFDAIKPLLSRMGTNVIHAGQAGSGHAVKGLNNLLAATILVATGEVFNAGTKFGLDPRVMQQIVSASSGGSFMSSIVWPKAIIPETWDFGFTTQLMKKDVDIGMSILQAMGMKATVSSKSAAVWSDALSMMGSNTDMTEVVKFLRKSD